jgi:hypothetical protein
VGYYTKNDTIHYDAFWKDSAWVSKRTYTVIAEPVTEITKDQRGTPIESPPCAGSYYIKKSTPIVIPVSSGKKVIVKISNGILVFGDLGAKAEVRIYNTRGRLIASLPAHGIVNLRSLVSPGSYIVLVTTDKQRFTLKYLQTEGRR